MGKSIETGNESYCIYIRQNGKDTTYAIGYTTDLLNVAKQLDETGKIIYARRFQNSMDALGHKLFLEQISKPSLRRIIRRQNPKQEDLTKKQ